MNYSTPIIVAPWSRLARAAVALAVLWTLGSGGTGAHAQGLPSPRTLAAKQLFVQGYAHSASCMIHGARIAIMQGAQNRDQARGFIETACLPAFRTYFVSTGLLGPQEAAQLWVTMTDRAIDEAIDGPDAILIR